jgi:flagellar motor protein MotB
MRGGTRRRHVEDEEESAFVSMTDMTVSFLFIVMILLAFFASQFDDAAEKVPRVLLDQAHAEVARLTGHVEAAERQAEMLKAEVEALQDENARLKADLGRANTRIAELETEIERLRAMIRQLEVRDPLEAYISDGAEARRRILGTLRNKLRLRFPDLQVVISEESDALRFQGDGLFDRGQALLRPEKRAIVDAVSEQLQLILPCYTLGPVADWSRDCNPAGAVIEAVQIEGHTDTDGNEINNLRLSTARANETFVAMTGREPTLVEHLNVRDQSVISVAGYGEMRPVAENDTAEHKATNRRIDLRIIMYVPQRTEEIERIRTALDAGIAGAGR